MNAHATIMWIKRVATAMAIISVAAFGTVRLIQLATGSTARDSAVEPILTTAPPPFLEPSSQAPTSAQPPPPNPRPSPSRPPSPTRNVPPPHVKVAGPTLDDAYPNSSGCHLLWFKDLTAKISSVGVAKGSFDAATPAPTVTPTPKIGSLDADFDTCLVGEPGLPKENHPCVHDAVISPTVACGIRPTITTPAYPGVYRARLTVAVTTLCEDARTAPCSAVRSVARPVYADWSVTLPIGLTVTVDGDITDHCVGSNC